ncbi:50S ribosomal protein L18 [Salibacter sp.]|jgi:large subunit ribosomal protein L18|uniref:50S ribosomal protein L18 n=1 Tax=Salibacter sp. TaxID=2010995 RepID=UPI00286FC948|nr:50S ribosomal protein L18 [Salibacter sp.]MDR9398951.1 50S ribosomal protein L18 [Salibacter sp.]MDR9488016.1 50S ribosomal protein L18 [Salibacter sp.]
MAISKLERRNKIKRRIRKSLSGDAERPRLSVYRSNKEFYAQIIDDKTDKTILSVTSLNVKEAHGIPKKEQAKVIGKLAAEKAVEAGINKVVFDRNGYLYHGRVKAFADAAREAGLKF